jgi:aldehyde:ferredoxin oxidoreductase
MEMMHVVNAVGVCQFAVFAYDWNFIPDFLKSITGWDINIEECYRIGERIANVRHAFNLREGLNPLRFHVPSRLIGDPPQLKGNVRNITVDIDTQVNEYCGIMDWDPETAVPSKERLESLGLDGVAADLHG